ncbi:hypothetical protein NADE_005798 [Nannochloris sp. 'desiccata']|nr:hypothetical protein NADE_005798 [Chlorella desiccata (nom. nud.)]
MPWQPSQHKLPGLASRTLQPSDHQRSPDHPAGYGDRHQGHPDHLAGYADRPADHGEHHSENPGDAEGHPGDAEGHPGDAEGHPGDANCPGPWDEGWVEGCRVTPK